MNSNEIPFVDLSERGCEETYGMIGDKYLRCGATSLALVQHRGRSEGPYAMCLEHADHNIRNRNAECIGVSKSTSDVMPNHDALRLRWESK